MASSATPSTKDWQQEHKCVGVADDIILKNHRFARFARTTANNLAPDRMKHILKDIKTLTKDLPDNIFVRYGSERPDYMKILIVGPQDTPYEGGLFEFDLWCSATYPLEPPEVQFRTTGGDSVGFNPNLYKDGTVCLSILGTWSETSWQPNEGTILGILIVLQACVLVPEPYINEPGLASTAGSQESSEYNRRLHGLTVRVAMLDWIEKKVYSLGSRRSVSLKLKRTATKEERRWNGIWDEVVRLHFLRNREKILKVVECWIMDRAIEGSRGAEAELAKYYPTALGLHGGSHPQSAVPSGMGTFGMPTYPLNLYGPAAKQAVVMPPSKHLGGSFHAEGTASFFAAKEPALLFAAPAGQSPGFKTGHNSLDGSKLSQHPSSHHQQFAPANPNANITSWNQMQGTAGSSTLGKFVHPDSIEGSFPELGFQHNGPAQPATLDMFNPHSNMYVPPTSKGPNYPDPGAATGKKTMLSEDFGVYDNSILANLNQTVQSGQPGPTFGQTKTHFQPTHPNFGKWVPSAPPGSSFGQPKTSFSSHFGSFGQTQQHGQSKSTFGGESSLMNPFDIPAMNSTNHAAPLSSAYHLHQKALHQKMLQAQAQAQAYTGMFPPSTPMQTMGYGLNAASHIKPFPPLPPYMKSAPSYALGLTPAHPFAPPTQMASSVHAKAWTPTQMASSVHVPTFTSMQNPSLTQTAGPPNLQQNFATHNPPLPKHSFHYTQSAASSLSASAQSFLPLKTPLGVPGGSGIWSDDESFPAYTSAEFENAASSMTLGFEEDSYWTEQAGLMMNPPVKQENKDEGSWKKDLDDVEEDEEEGTPDDEDMDVDWTSELGSEVMSRGKEIKREEDEESQVDAGLEEFVKILKEALPALRDP